LAASPTKPASGSQAEGFEDHSLGAHYHPGRIFIEERRPAVMRHHHWHGHVEINLPFDEDVEYRINGRSFRLPANHLGVFWAAVPHRLVEAHGCQRMMIAYVPIQQFLIWPLDETLFNDVIKGAVMRSSAPYPLARDHLAMLIRDFERQDSRLVQLVSDDILTMLKRTTRYGWTRLLPPDNDTPRPQRRNDPGLEQVRVMLDTIAQRYDTPLTLADIAHEVGLHPNYAMNQFKKVMRTSIKQYITRLRINHAKALLADTRRPILDIALAVGFSTNSRFYAAFKRFEATTPQRFREAAQSGPARRIGATDD